ncbi:MAG: TetR/AcrR family transcriptional regulator [Clostridia bacterium]
MNLPEERKKEIIEKTKLVINEKGIDKVSIRDIVKSVDMAQGLVYYYFKNKEEIVDTIAQEYVNSLSTYLIKHINQIKSSDSNLIEKIEDISQLVIDIYVNNKSPLKELDEKKNKQFYQNIIYKSIQNLAITIENAIKIATKEKYIDVQYPKETTYMLIYGIVGIIYNNNIVDKKIIASLIIKTLNIK